MKRYAIIVAGGTGTRMKSDVPKQFLPLNGQPIILQTLLKFREAYDDIKFIVVLPKDHLSYWEEIKTENPFLSEVETVHGGATRTESVFAGLSQIDGDGLVAIHDAVRPYVNVGTIRSSYVSAAEHGSGVAVVPLKDSIREVMDDTSVARERSNFVLVQTPQTFKVSEIKKAHQEFSGQSFTDDASVYEAAGLKVCMVEGSYSNIKITTPEDL